MANPTRSKAKYRGDAGDRGRAARPVPRGWLLEARGDARPRGMMIARRGATLAATELGLRLLRPARVGGDLGARRFSAHRAVAARKAARAFW